MTTISIQLARETTEKLRLKASQMGKSLESYLRDLAEENAKEPPVELAEAPSLAEFDRWLDELSGGPPALATLPTDFSRADIYLEHD
jgi:hypothetical protein